jgi:hypothetical protein
MSTDLIITIFRNGNDYAARVDNGKAKAKKAEHVTWQLEREDGFPKRAPVILQFIDANKKSDDGPFIDGSSTHGRYTTTAKDLGGTVDLAASGPYAYKLSYIDGNGTERLLLDPEIIVDGMALKLIQFLRALQQDGKKHRRARLESFSRQAKRPLQARKPKKRAARKR